MLRRFLDACSSFTSWLAGPRLEAQVLLLGALARRVAERLVAARRGTAAASTAPMCWYQAEACSVKYGLARCGRASATRSALPEASSVFTWSGVVTAPTVMVAMPTSLRTQSENGAWYMRP